MVVDEASSRLSDGIIITQPYVFSKGPVITQNELNRYAVIAFADTAWSRGQYTLTIEVQSIDEDRHQIEFRLLEAAGSPVARREDRRAERS